MSCEWRELEELARLLGGRVIYQDTDEFHGLAGNDKTTIVLRYEHDDL